MYIEDLKLNEIIHVLGSYAHSLKLEGYDEIAIKINQIRIELLESINDK